MRGSQLRSALLCAMLFVCAGASALAQSGRRQPKPKSPAPPAAGTQAGEPAGVSDSDAKAKQNANAALFGFYVLQDDSSDVFVNVPIGATEMVIASFAERLRSSPNVNVTAAGKGGRKAARDHAKIEKDVFTVLLHVDVDQMNASSRARRVGEPIRLEDMIVRYYVYAPVTATLKVQGQVYLRPYQGSARVGGIRLPLPTPRTVTTRIPVEYIFEQAGRDAAERVAASLEINLPAR